MPGGRGRGRAGGGGKQSPSVEIDIDKYWPFIPLLSQDIMYGGNNNNEEGRLTDCSLLSWIWISFSGRKGKLHWVISEHSFRVGYISQSVFSLVSSMVTEPLNCSFRLQKCHFLFCFVQDCLLARRAAVQAVSQLNGN